MGCLAGALRGMRPATRQQFWRRMMITGSVANKIRNISRQINCLKCANHQNVQPLYAARSIDKLD
jgi:hypothetical protein